MDLATAIKRFDLAKKAKDEDDKAKLLNFVQKKVRDINPTYQWVSQPTQSFGEYLAVNTFYGVGFGVPRLEAKEMVLFKHIAQEANNYINGVIRKKSKGVISKHVELTPDGRRALRKLAKKWNATENLVVDTLLLDESLYEQKHSEFMKNVNAEVTKLRTAKRDLVDENRSFRDKVLHLKAQQADLEEAIASKSKALVEANELIYKLSQELMSQNGNESVNIDLADNDSDDVQMSKNDLISPTEIVEEQDSVDEVEEPEGSDRVSDKSSLSSKPFDTSDGQFRASATLVVDVEREQPFKRNDPLLALEPTRESYRPNRSEILARAKESQSEKGRLRLQRKNTNTD